MASVFLPAPLCDPSFVSALGLDPEKGQRAILDNHGLSLADGCALPGLSPERSAQCAGELIPLPLIAEGPLRDVFSAAGCELVPGTVAGQTALLPRARRPGRFDAEQWRARALPVWVFALSDILSLGARFSPEDVARRLPMILSRSDSCVRARANPRPDRSGFDSADVQLEDYAQPYTEYFAINEYLLRHPKFDGGTTPPLRRAVFMAADAVTVLPYDPARDRVLLVEQFRAAPYARGDRNPWLLEPIAGRIEPGDTPEETAHKEAAEEAGLNLQALHRIGGYYPSTGCFSEYLVSFIGIADLHDDTEGLYGLESEGEDIRTHLVTRSDLLTRIAAGEMPDGPLLLSAYWLELNHGQLQSG